MLTPLIKWYIHRLSKKSLPKVQGDIRLQGINEAVEILRDKWGVPHIYGKTKEDAFFGQGFCHAQDRLFQMELMRRISSGTASEILGEDLLQVDRVIRTLDFRNLAAQDIKLIEDSEVFPLLKAFVKGVNQAILQYGKNLPFEFKLLKVKPKAFTLLDMLTLGRMVAFQMSYGWLVELDKQSIVDLVGVEKAAELDIHYRKDLSVVLPNGNETYSYQDDGRLAAFSGPYLKPFGGSNNWSVAPHRSASGGAVVCNDPHLPLMQPCIWYENHLSAPGLEVTGASAIGIPTILIGHNKHISWGVTLAFTDIQDTYVERFTNEKCTHYHFKGDLRESTIIEEKIKVKGRKEPYIERVVRTHHGPVISDIVNYKAKKITLQSKALQPGKMVQGFYEINLAKNWNDFTAGVEKISAPALNIAYGDTEGNIGYWMTGQVPKRPKLHKTGLTRSGSSGEDEWEGDLPFAEMPHTFNPKRGVLFTCNNKIINDDYPHYIGDVWMNGFRATMLDRLFKEKEKFDHQDFIDMQLNFHCIPGLEMATRYLNINSNKPAVQAAIELLRKWDGNLTADSVGGCIYQVVKNEMTTLVIGSRLDEALCDRFKGTPPIEKLTSLSEYFGHDVTAVGRILDNPKSWWNQQAGGTEAILLKTMEIAVDFLSKKLGADMRKWQWGSLHQVTFSHPFAEQKPMDKILNIGPFPIGGDADTPCQMSYIPNHPYDGNGVLIGAAFRQVVDLGDFSKSLSSLPPGQSGNPLSPHYKDQVEDWLKGKLRPMLWRRTDVEANLGAKLILQPLASPR